MLRAYIYLAERVQSSDASEFSSGQSARLETGTFDGNRARDDFMKLITLDMQYCPAPAYRSSLIGRLSINNAARKHVWQKLPTTLESGSHSKLATRYLPSHNVNRTNHYQLHSTPASKSHRNISPRAALFGYQLSCFER
jgi:hypothetical protein